MSKEVLSFPYIDLGYKIVNIAIPYKTLVVLAATAIPKTKNKDAYINYITKETLALKKAQEKIITFPYTYDSDFVKYINFTRFLFYSFLLSVHNFSTKEQVLNSITTLYAFHARNPISDIRIDLIYLLNYIPGLSTIDNTIIPSYVDKDFLFTFYSDLYDIYKTPIIQTIRYMIPATGYTAKLLIK